MDRPWYVRYYQERFLEEYEPFDEVQTQGQVEFAAQALHLAPPARILDLACGWGRHSHPLERQGYEVVGLDLNAGFLRSARASAPDSGRWVRGDMRRLPFTAACFDAVICLWNSFGYFDDRDNARVIQEAARLLAPGGCLLLDIPNRDFLLLPGVLGQEWGREGESYVLRARRLDPLTSVLHNEVWLLDPGGGRRWYEMRIRCYTFPEMQDLLARAGLEVEIPAYGGYRLSEMLTLHSFQMVVVARKLTPPNG